MTRSLGLLVLAVMLGGLAHHALEAALAPRAAHADGLATPAPAGMEVAPDGRGLVVTAGNTTLTLEADGTVSVTAPERILIGAVEDVNIEGYRVRIRASSGVEVEAGSRLTVDASKIELGDSSDNIVLAGGDDPILVSDYDKIVKSQRVRSR